MMWIVSGSRALTRVPMVRVSASVLGLHGLTLAVPLLLLLAAAPTFFSAHGTRPVDIISLTVAVVLLPPAGIILLLWICRALVPPLFEVLQHLVVGAFAGVFVATLVEDIATTPVFLHLVVGVVATVFVAHIHLRDAVFRGLVRTTVVVPLGLAVWFLGFSPVSALVRPPDSSTTTQAGRDDHVVVLVFDELPLAALLDSDGTINERRFPVFGRLEERSTWYRRATTVASWTHLSVPALLSGQMPDRDAPSTHHGYPQNLFTMLSATHRIDAHEAVTAVCPPTVCHRSNDRRTLLEDTAIVSLHTLLPRELAAKVLPPIGDRWSNFRSREGEPIEDGRRADQRVRFRAFINSLKGETTRPTASFAHFLLPHFPLRYLPSGDEYDGITPPPGLSDDWVTWSGDRALIDVARQRFLLQVKYVDRLVGRVIDTLRATGMYDDTLLVVTSDHGVGFGEHQSRRASPLTDQNAADIAAVPLFVKYPNQKKGSTDDQPARIIDVLPTVADVLDVRLGHQRTVDGRSLLRERSDRVPTRAYADPPGRPIKLPSEIDLGPAVARYRRLFGDWAGKHDVFAWGPHRGLLGRRESESTFARTAPTATLVLDEISSFDAGTNTVPSLVQLRFDEPPAAEWFAVIINGRVAGLGRSYRRPDGPHGIAMVDAVFIRQGPNALRGMMLDPTGGNSHFKISATR